jgi:PIN domain nuclease of toxin-antitoxin system
VIVLDTHAWIWWLTQPDRLGKKAARAIERAEQLGVPAICVWEVATKARLGKLKFSRPHEVWLEEALAADSRIELLHLLPRIAVASADLSWEHRDPADRMIVATARTHDAPLVTADTRIAASQLVRCVWE